MKGVGSYNDWPYYALPPSNLSAFAAPFSVHRSTPSGVSAPFMDSAESADSAAPIQFRSYGYDFFSNPVTELNSSKPYTYSGLQSLDSYSAQSPPLGFPSKDHSPKSSFAEAPPYYPSYVSSTIHDHSSSVAPNLWSSAHGCPSLDGQSFGDFPYKPSELGFVGLRAVPWNPNPPPEIEEVGLGTSFSSMHTVEERMNQGYQDMKGSNNSEWAKHNAPASTDQSSQLDDKSCWWEAIKPPKVERSGTSVMQPLPMSMQTHHESPLKLVADSGNHHLSYTDSCDKHSRHGDNPARVDIVSSVSSIPRTGLVTDLNIAGAVADGDIGHNNFDDTKEEAYHMPSPGTGCFDVGLLRRHLERNEPSSSKNAMDSNKNVSRDVADHIFKERPIFQNPCALMDCLNLRVSAIEDLNSVEKSFEGGDRCNPAEDSPCWKGASARNSQYKSYDTLPPGYVPLPPGYVPPPPRYVSPGYAHGNEECFGSAIQEPENFLLEIENNVKKSCENSNSYQMHAETVCQETNSACSPRKFSPTKFIPKYYKSDCVVGAGPFQTEPTCDFGLQCTNDITKMKEINVPSAKIADFESVASHTEHQASEENELIPQKQHTSSTGNAAGVCNVNKCSEYDISSYVAEHGLSSPSSGVNSTTAPENSIEKVSTKKLNVQMLVDTMQNLSELLLGHCLNDHCELNVQECNALKNVISNLNSCTVKNAEQSSPARQDLFNQSETFRCAGEPRQCQQNASSKRPQLTKTGPVEFENLLVAEANPHFMSGKPHGKILDSISVGNDAEMRKADNMTKDLKRILSENFHDDEEAEPQALLYKNLWLEAEAALCSVHYRARYNQMKIEMDKHSNKKRDIEEQSKPEVIPTLSQSQSFAIEVNNYLKPDSSDQDLSVLDATKQNERSSIDMNKPDIITCEEKGSQDLHGFLQNYIVSSTDKEAGRNDEASVMARYHVLKARADRSPNTTNLEEPSDIADKLAAGGTEGQNQVNICQDSPPKENKTDYEASVVARFHILKSRVEDSSSISSEGKPLSGVGSVAKGMNDTTPRIASDRKSLDACVNPAEVHFNSDTTVDKSIPKKFHLDWEGNQESLTHGSYEFQLPTYYSDGLASDWEHVEKSL